MKRWIIRIALLTVLIYGAVTVGYNLAIAVADPKIPSSVKSATKQETPTQAAARLAKEEAERQRAELTVEDLVELTNIERVRAGLNPVTNNTKLNLSAQAKAQDMAERNYWAHDTPDGKSPFTFITAAGYSFDNAGENLACGHPDNQTVVTGWMNSPKHRENMLKTEYTEVGFGIIKQSIDYKCGDIPPRTTNIIVQHFGTPL